MEPFIRISVRNLVEFILQSGSIDSRGGDGGGGFGRAEEGSRIHRRLQRARKEQYQDAYQAEVFLALTLEYKGISYRIEGRADGILQEAEKTVIEEIKTVEVPLRQLQENPLHWAQAVCYAYLYSLQQNLEDISVRLIYFQTEEEQEAAYLRHYSFAEAEAFFFDLLEKYRRWAEWQFQWEKTRGGSLKQLIFPFPEYRKGQRSLAVAVYRTIAESGRLFCQAPTGIGKTISTLFPALKAMGEGMGQRLFYLTAKTITRQAAEEAFQLMRNRGLQLKSVTLTAKDKICFLEERQCDPDHCPYADGYYDRLPDSLYQILQEEDCLTREVLERYGRTYCLCPFELSLDCTLWCDAVICDYNYLFDPTVFLKRFFDSKGEYLFLIDEAHNLVDRSREMYSASLCKSDFLLVKRELRELEKKDPTLHRALQKMNAAFLSLRKELKGEDHRVQREPFPQMFQEAEKFSAVCSQWLEEHRREQIPASLLDLYFAVRFFLLIREFYDERYRSLLTVQGNEVVLQLLCLDPSKLLDRQLKKGRAAIFFSATLSPLDYFISILGGDGRPPESREEEKMGTEEAEAEAEGGKKKRRRQILPVPVKRCSLLSPFAQEKLGLLIADRISTKYVDRERSAEQIAEMLEVFCTGRPGNYLVYFPSYQYMHQVYQLFVKKFPEVETLVQTSSMGEEEREAFLRRFDVPSSSPLLGFCVLGGIYAEGIDLKGDRLIGTAVVGVGLPQIHLKQNILRDYYEEKNGMGFAFAYQYPGMNKVLQAAGRVIRGEEDRGLVLLIDTRFSKMDYQRLFPPHWSHAKRISSPQELRKQVEHFWQEDTKRE